jgi:methylmalonyl-CoA/ethylmalonyl-CoA epimerase
MNLMLEGKLAYNLDFKPHHLGISVPDLESSIKWYEEMLGFKVERRMEVPPLKAKIAFMKKGNFKMEIFQVEGASPLPEGRNQPETDIATHGVKHLAYEVKNVTDFMNILKKRGVDIAMDVNKMDGKEMAFILDNSGNLIEILEHW